MLVEEAPGFDFSLRDLLRGSRYDSLLILARLKDAFASATLFAAFPISSSVVMTSVAALRAVIEMHVQSIAREWLSRTMMERMPPGVM